MYRGSNTLVQFMTLYLIYSLSLIKNTMPVIEAYTTFNSSGSHWSWCLW